MALIVLASASASPGVTATAVGLAVIWPRPVLLLDADPTGGSAIHAGYLRGMVPPVDSLLDLALANRHGLLVEAISETSSPIEGTHVSLISGIRSHAQAPTLTGLWNPLAAALKSLERTGQDVIVDAGRLGLVGSAEPLMYAADLCLLTTRSDLVSLSGARSWAATLRDGFERTGGLSSLSVLMAGEGDPYSAREVRKVLQLPVTASLAWDPDAARVFAKGAKAPKKFDSSPLVRSLRAAQTAITATVTANRADLTLQPVGSSR